jgi:hypothetical protein
MREFSLDLSHAAKPTPRTMSAPSEHGFAGMCSITPVQMDFNMQVL